jgi:adenylyltransferase/sulfurtransferase
MIIILNRRSDIPMGDLEKSQSLDQISSSINSISSNIDTVPVVCVCRRGNDSQLAVQKIKEKLTDSKIVIKDITGGLTAWAKTVDKNFPVY